MRTNLISVFALLMGTLFLFLGNGLHGLLLPMRGAFEGYETTMLGLLGTSWASGFVLGCLLAPTVVKRIGHVRAFSGFAFAGAAMIVESWLNERATNESRGLIFSLYIAITLIGTVGGQMTVALGDVTTPMLFMFAGILYCLAMLPTTLSTAASPQPLKQVRLDIPALYRTSPIACVGIVLIGLANGAFGTLGAVFGASAGLSSSMIAIMMSVAIFAGAVMQLPAGRMSDRIDRRIVLAVLSAVAAGAGLSLFVFQPASVTVLLVLTALYGATANALYPIAVSHANDFASPEDFVKVSGGLLLLYGIGTIIGPTLGGPIMSAVGPYALFAVTCWAHIMITAYAIIRSRRRAAKPAEMRDAYTTINPGTLTTPESLQLSPRALPQPQAADEHQEEKTA